MNLPAAKKELAGEAPSNDLDALADALLLRVAQFFGKCISNEHFCGFQIDTLETESGGVAAITIVPCDMIDGQPVRRVAKSAAIDHPRIIKAKGTHSSRKPH